MSSVCRVCLAGNTTLYSLKNNLLINFYDKLSSTKFNSEDARSRALCCFCYQKLMNCYTFSQMAHRSEKILSHLFLNYLEPSLEYIAEVNGINQPVLSVTTMQFITIDDNMTKAGSQLTIKNEPISGIDIKEEMTAEQDELVEVDSVGELSLQLDNDRGNDVGELNPNSHVEQSKPDDSKITFICNNCNKIFDLKSKLISHITNSHSQLKEKQYSPNMIKNKIIQKKLFPCNVCDKQYTRNFDLVKHMRTHTGEKPFACDVCDKNFYVKTHLISHIRTHTGVKPFACKICDKEFALKSTLVCHLTTHSGVKPFACNVCDKSFNRNYNLVTHMRTHTGEKPFACNVCDKNFYAKGHLVKHIKTHTEVKPYPCNICDKQYIQKCDLVRHIVDDTARALIYYL